MIASLSEQKYLVQLITVIQQSLAYNAYFSKRFPMHFMEISNIIDQVFALPLTSKSALLVAIHEVELPKGYMLFKTQRVEKKIYFIKKGMVRAFAETNENEITFWFGKEGDAIISMRSYVENQSSYENIELLEDCVLYELHTSKLQSLFENDIHIANWGRKFAEKELVNTEERLISRQFKTATERYKILLDESPDLIQRVQLGYIASYLGITQVSLSRIRAEIR